MGLMDVFSAFETAKVHRRKFGLLVATAAVSGCAAAATGGNRTAARTADARTGGPGPTDVNAVTAGWKSQPRQVAQKMVAKYGQPDEITSERLIWHKNGPWKRTELVNEEIEHNFPMPHKDMLLQVIDYRVPPERFDDLALYDGSVIAERTKGEIGARCDKEEANFLALNLADEIIKGKKSVDEARRFYAETMKEKKHQEYTKGFLFQVTRADQGDPDRPIQLAGR